MTQNTENHNQEPKIEKESISITRVNEQSIVIEPSDPQSDLPTFTFPLTPLSETSPEPLIEQTDAVTLNQVEEVSSEPYTTQSLQPDISQVPQLTFGPELETKEVTSIENQLHNTFVKFQSNFYTLINSGFSLEKILETFKETMNSQILVIDKKITIEHKPNIVVSLANVPNSTLTSFKLKFGFTGPTLMLNFINFQNLVDKETGIKCIVTVDINEDIQADILVEKQFFNEIIEGLSKRIDSENEKIKNAVNNFIMINTSFIEERYIEIQNINKSINKNFL